MAEGNFIPIECKKVNQDSGKSILSHPFKKIQIKRITDLYITGAYPIGMIFYRDEIRYILPSDIREDGQMSMEQYLSLPIFNWEVVIHDATEAHRSRFSK